MRSNVVIRPVKHKPILRHIQRALRLNLMCFMNWDERLGSIFPFTVYRIVSILKRKGIEYKICQMIYQAKGAHVVWPDHPQLPEQVLTVTVLRSSVNILWAKTHGPSALSTISPTDHRSRTLDKDLKCSQVLFANPMTQRHSN